MSTYGYVAQGGQNGGSPYPSNVADQYSRNLSGQFEYIDADHDILYDSHRPSVVRLHENIESPEDPDRILIRYMASLIPVNFEPYSISEEKAFVHQLRNAVAKHLQTDPRRIRLVYKNRDLKHDSWPLRRYNIKQNSEVAAIKTEGFLDYSDRESNSSSGSDTEASRSQNPRRRPRALSSVRHRSDEYTTQTQQAPRASATHLHPNGHVSAGTGYERQSRGSLHPNADDRTYQRREPSRSRSERDTGGQRREPVGSSTPSNTFTPIPIADPTTSLGKLQTLSNTFRGTWLPLCQKFLANPPSDEKQRLKEHGQLTESIMQHILLKADAIEVDSQDSRAFRKGLINEVNEVNKKLDEAIRTRN